MALWGHVATKICVNIGSGDGLLDYDTKPLSESISMSEGDIHSHKSSNFWASALSR